MTAGIDWPANPFWDFSLRLYGRAGVAPACLALQDRHGLDVNIVLYCAWLGGEHGVALSAMDVANIVASVAPWHDAVVRSLRALRTDLKGAPRAAPAALAEPFRAEIKRAELDAERIEQQILFTQNWSDASHATRSTTVARANIHAYLKSLGIQRDSEDEAAMEHILAGLGT